MKNSKLFTILAILLLGVFVLTNHSVQGGSLAGKWEYKIVYTASEDELNHLGAQGWEVTTAYGTGSTPYCILKRAK
jgi:hypothetical protein